MAVQSFDETAMGNASVPRTGSRGGATSSPAKATRPVMRKSQTGKRPSSQINSGGVAPGAPDSYDGRDRTRANQPREKKLDAEGPARVVRKRT